LALAPAVLRAQSAASNAPAPPQQVPCEQDPNFRQFDFWVGEWDVTPSTLPAGRPRPQSRIEKILNGCAILENWMPVAGAGGKSINVYNRALKKWEQTWVDGAGNVVHFTGEAPREGSMVLASDGMGPGGKRMVTKMTYTRIATDSVRQVWEQSSDGGKTWTTSFDGVYVRKRPGSGR
jgi:hypothetical protein